MNAEFDQARAEEGPRPEQRDHDVTVSVFSISAGMIGVCLAAIGILRLVAAQTDVQTVGDELLAVDSVILVSCCFLAFWSFKTRNPAHRQRLRLIVDGLFMCALLLMVGVCAIIACALI